MHQYKTENGMNLALRRAKKIEARINCPRVPCARTNELDSSYKDCRILTISPFELQANGSRDGRITHLRTQNAARCVNYCERSRIPQ